MFRINSQQGSKTQLGLIICPRWPSLSFPPPPRGGHEGRFKLNSEHCFIRNHYQRDLCSAWSVLIHHHHIHWHQLLFIRTPRKRVSWLLVRLSLCLFLVRFLGCLELCSNSHMTFPKGCSPWVWPQFTWTICPPGYHENHLIWVD